MAPKHVLIIDDSYELTRILQSAILTLDKSLDVKVVPSAEEAMLLIYKVPFDLIISDIRLPGISGMELLPKIRARNKSVNIVLITGLTDMSLEDKARAMGANRFLQKPIEMSIFLDTVASFLGMETPSKPTKLKNMVMGMPAVINEAEDGSQSVSETLAMLRTEIGAQVVWLINESGRLVAQASDNQINYDEKQWAPLLLPILSTGEKFANYFQEHSVPQSLTAFRFDQKDVVLVPVGDFALVLVLLRGKGHLRLPLVMDSVLSYQLELQSLLTRMGVLPTTPAEVMSQEPLESAALEIDRANLEEVNESELERFNSLFNTLPEKKKVDAFWDKVSSHIDYDLQNPEILSYEQAAKLGLAPEDEG